MTRCKVMLVATLLTASTTGLAGVSAQEAEKLGKSLTPIGAERAGNEDGSIPEWTPIEPFGKASGEFPNNPEVEADRPAYLVSAANVDQYIDKMSAGHKELFRRYPDSYKMIVYPTRRVANFPDRIKEETIKNATRASLNGVDDPQGAFVGFPFPIPQSGAEIPWNHRSKWRGENIRRYNNQMIVQLDGKFSLTKIVEDVQFDYASIANPNPAELQPGTTFIRYLSQTISPPRIAGTYILVHEKAGFGPEGRAAWLYAPALKRIRRAPAVCCDNPYEGTDGHQFYDQVDMYNGVLERFRWKLLGKREMLIPYNSYKIAGDSVKYADIAQPGHINQNLPRYELHRVWVVEAENKPDQRHTFSKRTMYFDEDTWNIVMIDDYDHQGQLMQFQEGHLVQFSAMLASTTVPEVIYHFNSGRYFVTAMFNEDEPYDNTVTYDDKFFEASSVQRKASK